MSPVFSFKSRVLYLFLFILLAVDLTLLVFYLIKKPVSTEKQAVTENKIITKTNSGNNKNKLLEIIQGDVSKGSLDEAEILVKVVTNPQRDKTGGFITKVELISSDEVRYIMNVNLGQPEDKFMLNKKNDTSWTRETVSSLMPLLKTGDTIKLRFYIQEPDPIINDPQCDTICKDDLNKIQPFIDNNIKIVSILQKKIPYKDGLLIGAITAISFN